MDKRARITEMIVLLVIVLIAFVAISAVLDEPSSNEITGMATAEPDAPADTEPPAPPKFSIRIT